MSTTVPICVRGGRAPGYWLMGKTNDAEYRLGVSHRCSVVGECVCVCFMIAIVCVCVCGWIPPSLVSVYVLACWCAL